MMNSNSKNTTKQFFIDLFDQELEIDRDLVLLYLVGIETHENITNKTKILDLIKKIRFFETSKFSSEIFKK